MTGTELHRLANGEGTLYVDGTPIGGIREFSVGPLAEAAEGLSAASGRRFTVEDVAAALGVPVELLPALWRSPPRPGTASTRNGPDPAPGLPRDDPGGLPPL